MLYFATIKYGTFICALQAESVHNSAVCGNKLMARDSRSGVRDAVTRQLLVEVENCFLPGHWLFSCASTNVERSLSSL